MAAKIIMKPFAQQGDVTEVPESSPIGLVNLTNGYTTDYEIDLTSGNPQAKPVERTILNFMFNMITENIQFLQQYGRPMWYANMPSGYNRGAEVVRQNASLEWRVYRSISNGNVTDPLTSPTYWNYIQSSVEMIQNIPRPSGGASGPTGALINAAGFNFNSAGTGTFWIQNDAIAALTLNVPSRSGAPKAGTLESLTWFNGGQSMAVQSYQDVTGDTFSRGIIGGVPSVWVFPPSVPDIQADSYRIGVENGANNSTIPLNLAFTPQINPATMLTGTTLKFTTTRTGFASSITFAGFAGTVYPLYTAGMLAQVTPNNIPPNSVVEVVFDRGLGTNGSFVLYNTERGEFPVLRGSQPDSAVTFAQLQEVIDAIPTLNQRYPIGKVEFFANGTDPNVAYLPTVWTQLPVSRNIRTSLANRADAMNLTGADQVTLGVANLPSHSHAVNINTNSFDYGTKTASTFSFTSGNAPAVSTQAAHTHGATSVSSAIPAHSHGASSANAGVHAHTLAIQTAGAHTHGITVASGGAHTHGASSNTTGNHTHSVSGTAADAGNHTHNVPLDSGDRGFGRPEQAGESANGAVTTTAGGLHNHVVSGTAATAGNHSHTITVASGGAHTHTASAANAGDHVHAGTAQNAGEHNHAISIAQAPAQTPTITTVTAGAGSHTHAVTLKDHNHTVAIGAHSHNVSGNTGAVGSGAAFNTVPASVVLVGWYRTA